ncbi:prepilin-type N-terminal cleavage/methylation domain-containing protein [Candidatus Wolfebacteria bacterium]|nr:prepilin-type N-terminal cleavage/methylation domain-containing protein [Candidatus Wolfebacteria bacterium]
MIKIKDILKSNQGFTLVELLIVFMVMALLAAGMIFYSRSGERQIILFQNQMKIVGALQRAKTLAIGAYGAASSCGYGVNFQSSDNTMIIFNDIDSNCANSNFKYSSSDTKFETVKLDKLIKFSGSDFDVVFAPPDPITYIDGDSKASDKIITISTLDNQFSVAVKITKFGQITTQ